MENHNFYWETSLFLLWPCSMFFNSKLLLLPEGTLVHLIKSHSIPLNLLKSHQTCWNPIKNLLKSHSSLNLLKSQKDQDSKRSLTVSSWPLDAASISGVKRPSDATLGSASADSSCWQILIEVPGRMFGVPKKKLRDLDGLNGKIMGRLWEDHH